MQLPHGRIADAALGGVDDALEGEAVGLVGDDAQIGERVADFEPLVKARAADDAIVEAERFITLGLNYRGSPMTR